MVKKVGITLRKNTDKEHSVLAPKLNTQKRDVIENCCVQIANQISEII
jgi:hypothetical protein